MGRSKPAGLQLDPSSGIWRIDKRVRGHGRLRESTGSCDLEEAERYLYRRLEQLRQASVYGVRQKRKWREAATRYLMEEAINKDSGADDVYRLKLLDQFLGDRDLHQIHDGTLAPFIAWRRQSVKAKRKSGKVWVKQVRTKTSSDTREANGEVAVMGVGETDASRLNEEADPPRSVTNRNGDSG